MSAETGKREPQRKGPWASVTGLGLCQRVGPVSQEVECH